MIFMTFILLLHSFFMEQIKLLCLVIYRDNYYVIPGKVPEKELSFGCHYKMCQRLFAEATIRLRKITHSHRHTVVIRLQQTGASDNDINL